MFRCVGAFFFFFFSHVRLFPRPLPVYLCMYCMLIQRSSKFEHMDYNSKLSFLFHCLFLVIISGSGKRKLDKVHRGSSNSRKLHLKWNKRRKVALMVLHALPPTTYNKCSRPPSKYFPFPREKFFFSGSAEWFSKTKEDWFWATCTSLFVQLLCPSPHRQGPNIPPPPPALYSGSVRERG